MKSGFIYILINDSFSGLIKIGSTVISAQERARQLSSNTAVPTPFKVAYEVYTDDCEKLEKNIHTQLNEFRVNANREFFNYPLSRAIQLIQNIEKNKNTQKNDKYEAIEILPQLIEKYGDYINPKLSSIKIYQTNERVYLEVTEDTYISDYLKDQHIYRQDLGYMIEDVEIEERTFNPDLPIHFNVERFLALDNCSMVVCASEIFTEEGVKAL